MIDACQQLADLRAASEGIICIFLVGLLPQPRFDHAVWVLSQLLIQVLKRLPLGLGNGISAIGTLLWRAPACRHTPHQIVVLPHQGQKLQSLPKVALIRGKQQHEVQQYGVVMAVVIAAGA